MESGHKRIPSLDGLRAVSIVMVVAVHTLTSFSVRHSVPLIYKMIFNGMLGVQIFFVISGFLITTLLLQEERGRGSISLTRFYIRRAFRILPPLYLYIGVIVMIGLAGKIALSRKDILSVIFFFHNYSRGPVMWPFGHLWSICVEEQFYLAWPVVLRASLGRGGHVGRMRVAIIPIAVLVLSPPLRSILVLQHKHPLLINIGLKLDYDFLMFGCLIALLQGTPQFEAIYRKATRVWWIPPVAMFLLGALSLRFQSRFDLPVGYTVTGASIAAFVLWCTRNPMTIAGKILNWQPAIHIGVLSYSIYLWQTLFVRDLNYQVFGRFLWIGSFPYNWIAILLVAWCSYFLVERPALRLRARLTM